MAGQFATVDELKSRLGNPAAEDAFLQGLLDEISETVEQQTGRSFTPNPALVQVLSTTVAASSGVSVGSIDLASATGVTAGMYAQITTATGSTDTLQVSGPPTGTTVPLAGPLDHPHAIGDAVLILADSAPDATMTVDAGFRAVVPIPDARSISAVSIDLSGTGAGLSPLLPQDYRLIGDSRSFTDLILQPISAITPGWARSGWPTGWSTGRSLTLTGRFGIWPIRPDIKGAVLLMAARAYKEKDARYSDMVELPDGGGVHYFRQMPPRAQLVLDDYSLSSALVA